MIVMKIREGRQEIGNSVVDAILDEFLKKTKNREFSIFALKTFPRCR